MIDLQNHTPSAGICARPGSLDHTQTLPPLPDNAQTQDSAVVQYSVGAPPPKWPILCREGR